MKCFVFGRMKCPMSTIFLGPLIIYSCISGQDIDFTGFETYPDISF